MRHRGDHGEGAGMGGDAPAAYIERESARRDAEQHRLEQWGEAFRQALFQNAQPISESDLPKEVFGSIVWALAERVTDALRLRFVGLSELPGSFRANALEPERLLAAVEEKNPGLNGVNKETLRSLIEQSVAQANKVVPLVEKSSVVAR